MELREAADIVQAMSDSLRSDPDQLHIRIDVAGQSVTSYGGTGVSVTARGGGPGSTTVGQAISVDRAQIRILRGQADEAMRTRLSALADSLDEIAADLRSPRPDASRIQHILDSLKGTWVPDLIIGVLSNVISGAIGL